jgi:hypothetical protein
MRRRRKRHAVHRDAGYTQKLARKDGEHAT